MSMTIAPPPNFTSGQTGASTSWSASGVPGADPTGAPSQGLRLDLGCGKNKKAGFVGVDREAFEGVDRVLDLVAYRRPPPVAPGQRLLLGGPPEFEAWPWPDASVSEVHCSHFIEHLDAEERAHFVNELYRVLAPGGKATIIAPSWSSGRALGDPTHKWPPVAPMWFMYLQRKWREDQAPHTAAIYSCDFAITWSLSYGPELAARNQEYVQFALQHFTDAAQDIVATFVKQ